jgi:hypothetical protein
MSNIVTKIKIMNRIKVLISAAILSISLIFAGCNKKEESGDLTINLVQNIAGKSLILNEWVYKSPAGHPYKLRRLQKVYSDFELIDKEGKSISFPIKHYFEFGRSETKSFVLKQIPPGTYNKLRFVFGLDEIKNKDNAYPNELDMINFKWPANLGGGYHYMRFEVTADSLGKGKIKDFNLHTGATFGNQNYLRITLPIEEMIVDGNDYTMDLVMDLNEWLQNPQVYDFERFGFGIMGNQEAQEILKENGVDVFSINGPLPVNAFEL